MKIKRLLFWILYHSFAKFLPGNYTPLGSVSKKIRYLICRNLFSRCGENVDIGNNVDFFNLKKMEIGSNSGIGSWSRLGRVSIGNYVMMGTNCLLLSQNHRFDEITKPMCKQGFQMDKPIIIEDDVWIGSYVIILPGVRVKQGSIVGAGSVVTKDVEQYNIIGGNPAQFIRDRREKNTKA